MFGPATFSQVRHFARSTAIGFISVLMLASCVSAKKKEEAALHLRIGTGYLQAGQYPAALRELLIAEKLDSTDPTTHNNLGLVYFMRERYELAEKHLARAIEINPKFTEARNNRARVLIELEKYEVAIRELKIVLNDLTYPDPAKAWVNLGLAFFKRGDFSEAKGALAEGLKIRRDNCLGQTLYGRSLYELGQLKTASRALDNAVLICRDSKYDEPHYYSGLTYYKLGETSSAVARMEEILKLYPDGNYARKAESMLKLMR